MRTEEEARLAHSSKLMLTRDELRAASGYKQPSRIRAWLDENHIDYLMPRRRDPWPRVMRSTLEHHFSPRRPPVSIEPNYQWLKKH